MALPLSTTVEMILWDGAILLFKADRLAAASSDKDKVYIKIVALNEIYNFVVEIFLTETI